MKFLCIILTSCQLNYFKSTLDSVLSLPNHIDIIININTLDELYFKQIIEYISTLKYDRIGYIKTIRTESNGKPGKGHNSCYELFKNTNHDYLFVIDGDDLYYPYAFNQFIRLIELYSPTAINLYGYDRLEINTNSIDLINKLYPVLNYNFSIKITNEANDQSYSLYHNFHNMKINMAMKNPFINGINATGTPTRLVCTSRKIFDIIKEYGSLYDEDMYIYDDFKTFAILYQLYHQRSDILFVYDNHIYLYNKMNISSVSYTDKGKHDNDLFITRKYDILYPKLSNWNLSEINTITLDNKLYTFSQYRNYKNIILDKILKQNISNNILTLNTKIDIPVVFLDFNGCYQISDIYSDNNKRTIRGTELAFLGILKSLGDMKCEYKPFFMAIDSNEKDFIDEYDVHHITGTANTLLPKIVNISPKYIIIQGDISNIEIIKAHLPNTKIFIWIHHDINVQFINNQYINYSNNISLIDKFIFVSNWQQKRYKNKFNIPFEKSLIIRNAISDIFLSSNNYDKDNILVYYGSPYRGLSLLKPIFERIKKVIPDIKLRIMSSFSPNPYDIPKPLTIDDIKKFTGNDIHYIPLYEELINYSGVEFYGSISQKHIRELCKNAKIYLYPCIFPETCCTSVLEMMYLKCNIISTYLGAIPETTSYMADYIDIPFDVEVNRNSPDDWITNPINKDNLSDQWFDQYANRVIKYINDYDSDDNLYRLYKQQEYVKNESTWKSVLNNKFIPLFNEFKY